ncbi:MAG: HNH endonuclease, partial [Bdellovibrionota bacterium]
EADLLEVITKVDEHRVFVELGFSSLFAYCTESLKLSESTAYNAITVARKSKQVPALKQQISQGSLSIAKARKLAAVITKENQKHWLDLAIKLPRRELERQIAKVNPKAAVQERAIYVSDTRLELKLGISEALMNRLKRVQDILSQRAQKAVSLEQALGEIVEEFLERKDPVRKAERVLKKEQRIEGAKPPGLSSRENQNQEQQKGQEFSERKSGRGLEQNTSLKEPVVRQVGGAGKLSAPARGYFKEVPVFEKERVPDSDSSMQLLRPTRMIPAKRHRPKLSTHLKHQVFYKYQGQCAHENRQRTRCLQRRWLEVHHTTPLINGGSNHPSNLTLPCRNHHSFEHP